MSTNIEPSPKSDNLAVAIYTYRSRWNDYLAKSYVDSKTPPFYAPSLKVLENWQTPAEDFNAAYEALTLALDFREMGESEIIPAMMRAVKDYLQRDEKRRQSEDASPALWAAIDEAERTHAAWMALEKDGELPEDAPEERAFDVAELAVINFPCQTIHDVRGKVAWLMTRDRKSAGPTARGSVQTNYFGEFMNSLLGLPVGKGA